MLHGDIREVLGMFHVSLKINIKGSIKLSSKSFIYLVLEHWPFHPVCSPPNQLPLLIMNQFYGIIVYLGFIEFIQLLIFSVYLIWG